jgi:serine/threonine protein kinase
MYLLKLTFRCSPGKSFDPLVSGHITNLETQNELRAVAKLCQSFTHENIVTVYDYGILPQGSHYYMDVELCELNLEMLIYRNTGDDIHENLRYMVAELPPRMRTVQIWAIMEDITCGLAYMHNLHEIHRDLKPSNSTFHSTLE